MREYGSSTAIQCQPKLFIQFTPYGVYSGLSAAQPVFSSNYAGATGTWASSNPLVMYVSQSGLAWALTAGTANITYTSANRGQVLRVDHVRGRR